MPFISFRIHYIPWSHTLRSIGYHNIPHPQTESVVRLMYLRVYDSRDHSSKTVPSPSLHYSLKHTHRSSVYRTVPNVWETSISSNFRSSSFITPDIFYLPPLLVLTLSVIIKHYLKKYSNLGRIVENSRFSVTWLISVYKSYFCVQLRYESTNLNSRNSIMISYYLFISSTQHNQWPNVVIEQGIPSMTFNAEAQRRREIWEVCCSENS